jgi:hypothetical protein
MLQVAQIVSFVVLLPLAVDHQGIVEFKNGAFTYAVS